MIEPVPATLSDRDAVMGLRDAAAAWMLSRGITQWVPGEITAATFETQIAAGEWWLLRDPSGVAGALRLLWSDVPVWGEQSDGAVYVHGLVVARDRVGAGIGRALLEWARQRAVAAGRTRLRLDCVETNHSLRNYYGKLGFREVGRREFPADWHPVVLLERTAEGPYTH